MRLLLWSTRRRLSWVGSSPMILEELRDLHLYNLTGKYIDEAVAKGTG
jgi:hypothetical protein